MKQAEKGLTLIELLISLGLLILITGSALSVLNAAQQTSEDSRSRLLALNAARSLLEEIKDTPVQEIGTIRVADYIPQNLCRGNVTLLTNPSTIGSSQLATITVRVSWVGSNNRPQSLDVTTMRSNLRS
jgi:type II secretory pathway pseudopilin PulG